MANLGFVGLGVMGSEMVSRLLDKGHTVTGYNRTRAKAQRLIDRGMKWGDSPRAVCAAADVTFSMVTNEKALAAIMEGPDGILSAVAPGKATIDMSTVSPSYSRSVALKAREKGADMIDAPVSGSVITLREGKLSVMVGGRREAFDRLKPILDDINISNLQQYVILRVLRSVTYCCKLLSGPMSSRIGFQAIEGFAASANHSGQLSFLSDHAAGDRRVNHVGAFFAGLGSDAAAVAGTDRAHIDQKFSWR